MAVVMVEDLPDIPMNSPVPGECLTVYNSWTVEFFILTLLLVRCMEETLSEI